MVISKAKKEYKLDQYHSELNRLFSYSNEAEVSENYELFSGKS